jgi:type II secretion system protein H
LEQKCRGAFTLVELVLVMAIMAVVAAISLPELRGFFRGRNMDSEALRFQELTRYGQSRAIAEGVPMVLWIDTRGGAYGLNEQQGYTDGDVKPLRMRLDQNLSIDIARNAKVPLNAPKSTLPSIYFLPEGVVGPGSVDAVSLQDGRGQPVWIAQTSDGRGYEIRSQYNANLRR